MKITSVKEVEGSGNKSVAELEEKAIEKAQAEYKGEAPENTGEKVPEEPTTELTDESVLEYLGKRYDRKISSFDELMQTRQENEELPEDVSAFLKYKKETGRGIEDFLKVQEDVDSIEPDIILRDYLLATEEGIDASDVDYLMSDYSYDEDLDDDEDIQKAKLAKKKAVAKARKYFSEEQAKYKAPLESKGMEVDPAEKEQYEAYKQYVEQSKTIEEENARKRDWFVKKTDELFGSEFKGFEFKVGSDKSLTFSPASAEEIKKSQLDPSIFVSKYLDDKGMIADSEGYHKALAVAMNPEKFAQFFYEQGQSDAADGTMRKMKNIEMSERKAPEVGVGKGGMKIRAMSPESSRGLKIRRSRNS